eukprot:2509738-Amphidinium_carterae.1
MLFEGESEQIGAQCHFLVCLKCAAYAERAASLLAKPCTGVKGNRSAQWSRIVQGRHPQLHRQGSFHERARMTGAECAKWAREWVELSAAPNLAV